MLSISSCFDRVCVVWSGQVVLQPDPFLSELTSMYERSTEKGSVWVTMKRCECALSSGNLVCDLGGWRTDAWVDGGCLICAASMKCQARLKKMAAKGEAVEYRCLVRATDGKKNICTAVQWLSYCPLLCWFWIIILLMVVSFVRNGYRLSGIRC